MLLPRNGLRCNGNKGVVHIPESSKTGASPSDTLVPYPRYSYQGWGIGSYTSAEMQPKPIEGERTCRCEKQT